MLAIRVGDLAQTLASEVGEKPSIAVVCSPYADRAKLLTEFLSRCSDAFPSSKAHYVSLDKPSSSARSILGEASEVVSVYESRKREFQEGGPRRSFLEEVSRLVEDKLRIGNSLVIVDSLDALLSSFGLELAFYIERWSRVAEESRSRLLLLATDWGHMDDALNRVSSVCSAGFRVLADPNKPEELSLVRLA